MVTVIFLASLLLSLTGMVLLSAKPHRLQRRKLREIPVYRRPASRRPDPPAA
ncbi:MAG: hypothetical protein ACLQUW_00575 [Desulfobaccales bacterium]